VRAALIPPKGFEHTALESDIHLVLPLPPLLKRPDYIRTYVEARKRGDYVILDNGCAEGQLVEGKTLLDFAKIIKAHEIVAPDIMGNAAQTLEATNMFLDENPEAADYNIMAVLQGETPNEIQFLLDQFAKRDEIVTIGVPKVHVQKADTPIRRDIVTMIHRHYPGRFQIHLLGLSNQFADEMLAIKFDPGTVRSMDSAQPYKITERGWYMSATFAASVRRTGYFTYKKEVDLKLLSANIATFKEWAARHES